MECADSLEYQNHSSEVKSMACKYMKTCFGKNWQTRFIKYEHGLYISLK